MMTSQLEMFQNISNWEQYWQIQDVKKFLYRKKQNYIYIYLQKVLEIMSSNL
jgi:hypothetical protein